MPDALLFVSNADTGRELAGIVTGQQAELFELAAESVSRHRPILGTEEGCGCPSRRLREQIDALVVSESDLVLAWRRRTGPVIEATGQVSSTRGEQLCDGVEEQAREYLDTVGVGLAVHILTDAVSDGLMVHSGLSRTGGEKQADPQCCASESVAICPFAPRSMRSSSSHGCEPTRCMPTARNSGGRLAPPRHDYRSARSGPTFRVTQEIQDPPEHLAGL